MRVQDAADFPIKWNVMKFSDHIEKLDENQLKTFFRPNWGRDFADAVIDKQYIGTPEELK